MADGDTLDITGLGNANNGPLGKIVYALLQVWGISWTTSSGSGGMRLIFSNDDGATWIKTGDDYGDVFFGWGDDGFTDYEFLATSRDDNESSVMISFMDDLDSNPGYLSARVGPMFEASRDCAYQIEGWSMAPDNTEHTSYNGGGSLDAWTNIDAFRVESYNETSGDYEWSKATVSVHAIFENSLVGLDI